MAFLPPAPRPFGSSWEGWLEAEAGTAPTEDDQRQALLAWWPLFKMRLSVKVAQLNRVAQMRRLEHGQRTRTAQAAQAAAEAAHQSNPTEATRMALVDAASEVQAATRADAAHPAHKARVAWLHSGERPSRVLTRVLAHDRPSGSNAGPPALRTAHGALVGDPIQKAQRLADFFAGISAQPPTTVAARAAVLQAVRDHGGQLTTEDDTTVGGLTVTCEDVQKALKQTQPGKSPGWDGIPADLHKAYQTPCTPSSTPQGNGSTYQRCSCCALGRVGPRPEQGLQAGNRRRQQGSRSASADWRWSPQPQL